MWEIVYTKQAQKDAKKLSAAGLRFKAEKLLKILEANPYQKPPSFKIIYDLRFPRIPNFTYYAN